jgi:hypothetical protein
MKLCKMERSTIQCSQALRRTSSASREFCQVRGVREVRPHSEVRMQGPSLVFEMLTGLQNGACVKFRPSNSVPRDGGTEEQLLNSLAVIKT